MVHINNVKSGLARFLETEMVGKLPGWKSWVFGAGCAIALERSDELLNRLRDNKMVEALGVIDGDMVDVETIYAHVKQQAREPITIDIPLIGSVRVGAGDIDRLYQLIMEG